MSLITDLFARPLDEGYAEAAQRRKAAGGPESSGSGPRNSVGLMIGLLGLGMLLVTAALQVRSQAGIVSVERESLVERIERATADADGLERALADVESDIVEIEGGQLDILALGDELSASLANLRGATGTGPVTGPGIVVEVDDAEDSPGGAASDETDVLDLDLQQVVNGLWAAGAEAISINGQRVTAMTAIRKAGAVIHVNFRPISAPYEVSAVGDSRTLASRFAEGPGGEWLRAAASLAGIQSDIRSESSLTLPAARAALRLAEPEEAT